MEFAQRLRSRVVWTAVAAAQIVIAAFGVSALLASSPATAVQSVPYLINFQGRLTDNSGNVLADGSYNIKFRLFDASTSGTNRWEGDRVYGASDHRITVQNGLFNIQFGDTSKGDPALSPSLFNSQTYPSLYLEVELPTPATATCASNGCASFTEGAMTPRQPLASAAYAFNTDTLDGLDSSDFAQLTTANAFTGANLFAPTTASTVALTVKATTAGSTNGLEVFDSGGTRRAYFDASGNLNLALTLQATTTNAVDIGASGTTFRTGYFGTSVVSPGFTGGGAVTLSSGGSSDLTLDSASNTTNIAANDTTLKRTAAGTYTIDLSNSSATTLAVTNSDATGGAVANLTVDGGITVGAFAAATSTPVCSNSGALATCNTNPSGVTLQQAYAAGAAISTTGSDVAFTLNSGQNFTVTTTTNTSGFTSLLRADGSGTADPAQLLLVKNNDVDRAQPIGIKVDAANANGKITTALDASSANITTALAIGGNAITGTNFNLNSSGDITTAFTALDGTSTTNGTGSSATSMVLNSVTNFDVGNYIRVQNSAACVAGGPNTCYAKVTAINVGSKTLTITPALTWANGRTVDEWHIPEIGGLDLTQNLTNRYGRGYFISGVATGNGTTYYNEDSIDSSLASFNFLTSNVTTLNIGSSGTAVSLPGTLTVAGQSIVNGSGQINGAQLQSGTVGNGALTNSAVTINGTGISGGGSVSLGGTLSLATIYGSTSNTAVQGSTTLVCPSASGSNITGTGNTITLGSGGTCNAIGIVNNPTFTGLVTSVGLTAGSGLIQGTGGLTVTGTTSVNDNTNSATSIGTGTSNALVSIGGGSGTFALNTSNIDISSGGAISGATGLSLASGNFSQTGSGTFSTGTGAVSLNGDTSVATTSTNAFLVQSASAAELFNLDTTNMNLAVNGNALTVVNLSAAATTPGVAAGANTGGTLSGSAATTYYYKVTALNSVGETTASPEVSINGQGFTPISTPGALTVALGSNGGSMGVGVYTYKVTFVTANGETSGGTTSGTCTTTSTKKQCDLSAVPTGPTGTTARKIYRTTVGGSSYFLVNTGVTFNNNSTTTLVGEGTADGTLGAAIPVSNTATVDTNNATITWTAVSGATSYRIYRGTASGAEDHYQVDTSSPFTDTGATGTAASPPTSATAGQVGIGTAAPSANLDVEGTGLFKNGTDSLTAFQIQNSAGTVLFVADTTDSKLVVGASTSDATQILLQLDSFSTYGDTVSCSTTVNQGALYYNTAASGAAQAGSNAVRACVNGNWEDLVTTGGLGIMLFGVVPDSGASPGDLASLQTSPGASISGPCKVSWVANAATSTVRIEACTAYSGGRKIVVQQNTSFSVPTNVNGGFSHICFNSSGVLSATSSSATEAANLPSLSVGAPVLCLADVKANATSNGVAAIYDTRAFTISTKEFVTTAAATPIGIAVVPSTTGVALPGAANATLRGVVVAGASAAAVNGAPNAIIATSGPVVAKASAGTAAAVITTSGTNGYISTGGAVTNTYSAAGVARNTFPVTACTATPNAANCNTSIFFNLNLR